FRRAGEAEAIRDAKDQAQIAAVGSVEPVVTDALVRLDAKAISAVDRVVQERVLTDASRIARVKIWDRSGRVVYSDEPRLIGARYRMTPADLAEFQDNGVSAEVSDLSKPENRFERPFGRLLEVYLPIHTPSGRPLRYETYYRSSFISTRGSRIFRQFAPVMLGGLVLLALIQLPLAWWLARRVQRGQDEREQLLRRAIEASDVERRRIARDLHDGVVQDLAAVSYSLSAAAEGAPEPYDEQLRTAAAETRQGIGQLRTLLVEIYPPELHRAGLEAALADLASAARARGIETTVEVDGGALGRETEALFFRVAQEALRNVVKHAAAGHVRVDVGRRDGRAALLVADDGRGFDPVATPEGHFGLAMLADLVGDSGGELVVDSAPGQGARVSVEVPA
ncbi:MAG TPA: histidine kinase, partial [Gaiellaceae bacterium]|nr:histidine kinase [Gaiellaceae bacterium]